MMDAAHTAMDAITSTSSTDVVAKLVYVKNRSVEELVATFHTLEGLLCALPVPDIRAAARNVDLTQLVDPASTEKLLKAIVDAGQAVQTSVAAYAPSKPMSEYMPTVDMTQVMETLAKLQVQLFSLLEPVTKVVA